MGWLFAKLADNTNPGSVSARLRGRRFQLFRELIAPLERPVRILDVGGTPEFWETLGPDAHADFEVVLLNRERLPVHWPHFSSIKGDATSLRRLASKTYDVVFSNSVIEHVGNRDAQHRMAKEVARVGRHYYVQTPNRFFPIEPHFLVPGFQFLPVETRVALVRRFNLGWYKRIPDANQARAHVLSHQLLSASQMRRLFPSATLFRERVLGLTKSLVAWGGSPASCKRQRDEQ